MFDDDAKAFALINECVRKLTKLAGARVPAKWQEYFSDGIDRHELAAGLKQFCLPPNRPGRPAKLAADFHGRLVESVAAEKRAIRIAKDGRPTDRIALARIIRRFPKGAALRADQLKYEVDHFAKRLSDARRQIGNRQS